MPEFETLRWEQEGFVATITFDRPEKKNAISAVMFEELPAAFDRAATDDGIRVVVLTGAGGAFCSGADLSDPGNLTGSPVEFKDRMARIHSLVTRFIECPKPTIA